MKNVGRLIGTLRHATMSSLDLLLSQSARLHSGAGFILETSTFEFFA